MRFDNSLRNGTRVTAPEPTRKNRPVTRVRSQNRLESGPCVHRGDSTGDTVLCPSCRGQVALKVFQCGIHGSCTVAKEAPSVACCASCNDFVPLYSLQQVALPAPRENKNYRRTALVELPSPDKEDSGMLKGLRWIYGVTTVPKRIHKLLPDTLAALSAAGFDKPILFVDGATSEQIEQYRRFNLPFSIRSTRVHAYGNWILGLVEMFAREPRADRYAIFQDDLLAVRNIKGYLDKSPYPEKGYLNLHTFKSSHASILGKPEGWHQGSLLPDVPASARYHGQQPQAGRSALALVFNREAVVTLLGQQHLITRSSNLERWPRLIDAAVVEAMNQAGWREYVHNPSLVIHTGYLSTIYDSNHQYRPARSFPGTGFDALSLLSK